MKRVLILAFGYMLLGNAMAQDVTLSEDQISYNILKWYYDRYQKAETDQWIGRTVDGQDYFIVSFKWNGSNYETMYDNSGMIIVENQVMKSGDIPEPISEVLDYRLAKYKVESFVLETHFQNRKPVESFYKVQAEMKKASGVVELFFDDAFNILPEKKVQLAIR